MKSAKAKTLDEVNQKLHSGDYKEVIVDFDISSDDFFLCLITGVSAEQKSRKRVSDFWLSSQKIPLQLINVFYRQKFRKVNPA